MAKTKYKANSTDNVSVGGGVKGGYLFYAPKGTPLPTDFKTKLDDAYHVLGYISGDGIKESEEAEKETLPDWNGDPIATTNGSRTETWVFTMEEVKADTLKILHGDSNVADEDGMITVLHNANPKDTHVIVAEMVLKNNRRWRKVIPLADTTAIGELAITSTGVVGRECTVTGMADENGNTCIDYIESTETEAAE